MRDVPGILPSRNLPIYFFSNLLIKLVVFRFPRLAKWPTCSSQRQRTCRRSPGFGAPPPRSRLAQADLLAFGLAWFLERLGDLGTWGLPDLWLGGAFGTTPPPNLYASVFGGWVALIDELDLWF